MLSKITLSNFKKFKNLELDLSRLTLLTGLNGAGKSTVLQSLLLLGQSAQSLSEKGKLLLNGDFVQIGTGWDLLSDSAQMEDIEIAVEEDGILYSYRFSVDPQSGELSLAAQDISPAKSDSASEEFSLPGFCQSGSYLRTDRIESFMSSAGNDDAMEPELRFASGFRRIWYWKGGSSIENSLSSLSARDDERLAEQVCSWMERILPGNALTFADRRSAERTDLNRQSEEQESFTNSGMRMKFGSGAAFIYPVIETLLAAVPGDLVLLEHPETWLHPRGQRVLGELISEVSALGVQVIVETHSDHLLNAVRLSVKNNRIGQDDVALVHFSHDNDESGRPEVIQPKISGNGKLDQWPEGFFDEWDKALMELF